MRCAAVRPTRAGNVQPETPQADRESYVANWIVPVEVNAVLRDQPYVEEFVSERRRCLRRSARQGVVR